VIPREGKERWGEPEITCPYCGHQQSDSWELDGSTDANTVYQGGKSEGTDCPECHRTFSVERVVDVTYSSRPLARGYRYDLNPKGARETEEQLAERVKAMERAAAVARATHGELEEGDDFEEREGTCSAHGGAFTQFLIDGDWLPAECSFAEECTEKKRLWREQREQEKAKRSQAGTS
jgi:hypothetical protein